MITAANEPLAGHLILRRTVYFPRAVLACQQLALFQHEITNAGLAVIFSSKDVLEPGTVYSTVAVTFEVQVGMGNRVRRSRLRLLGFIEPVFIENPKVMNVPIGKIL